MDYFRAMMPEPAIGSPKVGRSARQLGVRVPPQFPPDVNPNGDGCVHPAAGGMSVAPQTVWNLPNHRRPRSMGRGSSGPSDDCVFVIEKNAISEPLLVRHDKPIHALVEPAVIMSLSQYEERLAATRVHWKIWNP